jgi:hypothetical protein
MSPQTWRQVLPFEVALPRCVLVDLQLAETEMDWLKPPQTSIEGWLLEIFQIQIDQTSSSIPLETICKHQEANTERLRQMFHVRLHAPMRIACAFKLCFQGVS